MANIVNQEFSTRVGTMVAGVVHKGINCQPISIIGLRNIYYRPIKSGLKHGYS